MERMGLLRRGGLLALVGLLGLATVLGGCAQDKKKAEAAQLEAAELREKNAQLEQANRDTAARLTEAETKLAQQQSPGGDDMGGPTTTPGTKGHKTARSNTGESRMISRNQDTGLLGATLGGDVLFGSGSDVIKTEAKKTLDKLATEIKHDYGNASIRVEGYTDSDPIKKSKWGSNEKLSQARAESVRKYLISKGIKSGHIEAMGYGASKPKSSKAASRRVEVIVVQ